MSPPQPFHIKLSKIKGTNIKKTPKSPVKSVHFSDDGLEG